MLQWDLARAVPRRVGEAAVGRGDIQALAAGGDALYAATSDGGLWAWPLDRRTGELGPRRCHRAAHDDRVSALALSPGGILFSASLDGALKAWDAGGLALVHEQPAAHGGERLHAAALGADGTLYTGGDDGCVRRWVSSLLQPAGEPLYRHSAGVRALAIGPGGLLVSADKAGCVSAWSV